MADRKPWEMTDELPEKALLVRLIALVDEWDEQPSGEALLCGKQAVIDFLHGDDVRLVIAESIKELREELQSVLSDWNSLVAAIGSPTNGGAIGYARQLRDLSAINKAACETALQRYEAAAQVTGAMMAELGELRERLERSQAALKWIEKHSTLHTSVDILYVIDGYQVRVTHEGSYTPNGRSFQGETVEEACALAIREAKEGRNVL